jgi:hypothetical protein
MAMSLRNKLRAESTSAVPFRTLCYNPTPRRVQSPHYIMRFDLQDVALRTLILVAGGLAAVLLALKGQGQALPALAVGGTLGACVMARFGPDEQ